MTALVVIALLFATAGSAAPYRLVGDRLYDEADQPVVASWAAGLQDPGQLDNYAAAGFSLVYLSLPDVDGLCKELAREAARRGLGVILELNPIRAIDSRERLPLDSPAAIRATARWLAETVAEWQDTPGLVAWALQDEVEEWVVWSPLGFSQYLQWKYGGDAAKLSAAWGAEFEDFNSAVDQQGMAVDQLRPGKIGNAALDAAAWRRDGIQAVLRGWTVAVSAVDPEHPVIGGPMNRFRTLLAAPAELAGLQPAMLPAGGWHDPVLHQAGAVEVASQTGRFAALPWLQSAADPVSLVRWTRLMFGRGAAGVAFDSWADLQARPERLRAVSLALSEAARVGASSFRPAASAAVLLSPLARGPLLGDRAVFGYGKLADDEPAGLLSVLRKGSRHGPLDVLQPRDLKRVDLTRYGAIFLPAAFDLTNDDCERLRDYVKAGGVLFSDLGAGVMHAGGDLTLLPFPLVQACGLQIRDVKILEDVALNDRQRERLRNLPPGALAFPELTPTISHPGSLVFQNRCALFPEVQPVIGTPPSMSATLLRCPTAFFEPLGPEIRVIAEQTEIGGRAGRPPAYAGIAVNPFGAGIAIYCGNFLWQAWKPDDLLFDAVHDGVLRQRPTISEVSRLQLCDETLQIARGGDDRLWLHRVGDTPAQLQLDLPTLDGRLYVPGFNFLRRPLARDEASPVRIQPAPFINRRIVDLDGGALKVEAPAPLVLWPQGDGAAADITEYSAETIRMRLFGTGDQARMDVNGRWVVLDPAPCQATLAIADGVYPVKPGSLHRAEWWLAPKPSVAGDLRVGRGKRYQTLTAGPDGRLVIHETFTDELLRLTPVSGPAPAAGGE